MNANPLKKTLVKYFVSEDGTLSFGAIGIALIAPVAAAIMTKEMWPLSVDDLMKISATIPALMATLGWYRKIGKK